MSAAHTTELALALDSVVLHPGLPCGWSLGRYCYIAHR